jgi:hypothetical protein
MYGFNLFYFDTIMLSKKQKKKQSNDHGYIIEMGSLPEEKLDLLM